ncbi:Clp protease N-terminal domain-containing protein [Millisia brevis]|uniref:Clp protease N-terminal domain-containing protein n=1 Tax=Millisia brevis TaxID=264148 RepID=UPI0008333B2D|nr:Clp protease N-terminal domain-containing protein [Millisia brevis]
MTENPTPAQLTGVRLDDLIASIRTVNEDPLDQLTTAMTAAAHLGDIGDSLIGHFVDQARRAGASWTDIGASMGVTKQAAQKRFVGRRAAEQNHTDPFARFTPRARNAVVSATNQAGATAADHVRPLHLAHGLTTEPQSLAGIALRDLGVDIAALADDSPFADRTPDAPAMIPFDDGSKAVLEATVEASVALGHNYVGTEHLLLGLYTDPATADRLRALGADPERLQEVIVEKLSALS